MRSRKFRRKFVIIYVKFFRHYRTKQLIFPKWPNTVFRLKIPVERWLAYRKRKANAMKATTRTTKTAA